MIRLTLLIMRCLLNIFTIKATRKVGLHEPIPWSAFHNLVARFLALACIRTLCRSSPKGMHCLRVSVEGVQLCLFSWIYSIRSAGALSYMKNTFLSSGRRLDNSRVHWSAVCSCLKVGLYDAPDHVLSSALMNRVKLINIHAVMITSKFLEMMSVA